MNIAEIRREFDAEKAQFERRMQAAFAQALKEFWVEFPKAEVVSWAQFTPYFNDGDECVFSVHEASVNGYNSWGDFDETVLDEDTGDITNVEKECPVKKECAAFDKLLNAVGDDVMRVMYGDHTQVILRRDGSANIRDWEHD